MRLHRLTVTAFGPFGGTQTVDFDRLSQGGLFLLHGPTGAGKTSILDAVCFALYGSVPGARQSGQALRSNLADPLTLTEVVLDLTVGGRRLEITRLPEQPRPKKRGTGTTREKAQSRLREYVGTDGGPGTAPGTGPGSSPGPGPGPATGHWKALSRSHQEIGEEITRLLGMSKEQFCQVVLLPQGDFARFLRADAEARAKLLGKLFDTGRFAALEEELADRRRAAAERVTAGDDGLLALAHRIEEAAGASPDLADPTVPAPGRAARTDTPPRRGRRTGTTAAGGPVATVPRQADPHRTEHESTAPGPGDPGFAEAVLVRAAVARSGARERLTAAASAARLTREAETAAAGHLEAERERDRLQRRHAHARERAEALAGQAAEHERVRARLERARAAAEVAPALALRDAAWTAHDAAQHAERRARAALPPDLAGAEADRLAALERELRQQLGSLEAARRAERRAADIARERTALEREARADEQTLLDTAQWLAGWETERARLHQRVDAAQEAVAQADALALRLDTAQRQRDAARLRDQLATDLRAAEEKAQRAKEHTLTAHGNWLTLKERRLAGIAAELAAALKDGTPCAVCGATEHPAPARATAAHVDREAEERALEAFQRAQSAEADARTETHLLQERLTAATAQAGDASAVDLAHAVQELRAATDLARTKAAGLHAAREALARAEREHERRDAARQDAERRAAARTSRREALDRELAVLHDELTQARGESVSVAERATRLERQVALLGAAAAAARTAQECADKLKESDARLSDAAYRAGFDTPQAASEAQLDDARWRALQHRLDQWQAESAAVAAELADPEVTAAAALPPADPDGARRALDAASARSRAAAAAHTAAAERCAALDRLAARAHTEARELAPLRAEYERIARLAGLAAGTSAENARRMRLESYVLAARLEQVAAAASVRLHRMSSGRYTLVHSDERSGGSRRSGLGLHVVDAWTGHERDTATLSGGETFFASLALALGLADVVTDEAGGTRLDTLFIDEGFGSLDEQTLDEVLDVLDSLRERDRSVGIVSHVADLRQRIPAQLQVLKDRKGSSVRHRVAGE
ncbi:SMC family ATPase [Streptomyces sp. NPDC003077]|uniref:SMC family ATPase n=1 Tax=Streptomyces sp. NPDC003077 TaxID=3154443 RepID=UPI0033B1710B